MPPEDIDDLFRDKLAGHSTPPGEALWARLRAHTPVGTSPDPSAERLDALFQQRLNAHATPPGRELWERLEDEHLRPRKRRPAAGWPLAVAAALALLLLVGGAGLWLGSPLSNPSGGTMASRQNGSVNPTPAKQPANGASSNAPANAPAAGRAVAASTKAAATSAAAALHRATAASAQKNVAARATRSATLASTAPPARTAAPQQPFRHLPGTDRQPDAATGHPRLGARTTARAATRPASSRAPAADEQRPAPETAPVIAAVPPPARAPENAPVGAAPTPGLARAGGVITVDVRTGGDPGARPASTTRAALAAAEAPEEHRRLGGRLLQQAGHLVRGERLSLAEVTGLPENVTLRATIAGRSITKSIQL